MRSRATRFRSNLERPPTSVTRDTTSPHFHHCPDMCGTIPYKPKLNKPRPQQQQQHRQGGKEKNTHQTKRNNNASIQSLALTGLAARGVPKNPRGLTSLAYLDSAPSPPSRRRPAALSSNANHQRLVVRCSPSSLKKKRGHEFMLP